MHQLAEKWPPLSFFREGKIRLPASAGRSSVLDEWKRLVLTMDSGIRRNWSVAFACAKKWRSLSHNGENDSEMIISSSFRCWGKLPTVRSQMSAALLLKRQVCLIRSSLGEISSFLRLPLRSHIDGGFGCSWEVCVRRTIRGIRTAATIRSKASR